MKKVLALVVAAGICLPGVLGAQDKKKPDPEAQFKRLDTNNDSKLTVEEFKGKRTGDKATKAEEQFKKRDKNGDGFLSLEEFKAGMKKKKDK
jgi:Ca2+-binding EF-hand superfamily protein